MYFYLLSCILLLISYWLPAHEPLAKQPINITSQAAPDTFVNDTVHAIDGTFCYTFQHLAVPGHVPLDLVQYYNSKSRYSSWHGTGMSLNYSFWIQGREFADKTEDKYDEYCQVLAEAPGGSIILCLGRFDRKEEKYHLDPEVIREGLTNTGAGEISARTNLKNIKIHNKIKNEWYGDWTLTLPDGTVKEYYRAFKREDRMNVLSEIRPNRTRLDYRYYKYDEKEGEPKEISSYGNQLKFEINAHHKYGKINASNGKAVKFKYFRKGDDEYIHEISSSDNPDITFSYTHAGDNYSIDRISWPKGRFLEVEYDSRGRVIAQKAPVGKDGEKRTLYTFDYRDDHTKVKDAYGHKKIYRHKNKRLVELEEYTNDKIYRTRKYFWGRKAHLSWNKHHDADEGNLISEVLLDRHEKAHFVRNLKYDKWGNVKVETMYGNLSGNGDLSKCLPMAPQKHRM